MADKKLEKFIVSIAGGDMSALKALYDEFGHVVYSLSLAILKDRQLSEDCSQEVFIKIVSGARTYRTGGNPKAWIVGIVRNEAINTLRKQKGIVYSDYISSGDGQESLEIEDKQMLEDVVCGRISLENLLEQLDETSREILIMHLLTGLKFREISEVMNIPIGTVTWKYQMSLKKLKSYMTGVKEKDYGYVF